MLLLVSFPDIYCMICVCEELTGVESSNSFLISMISFLVLTISSSVPFPEQRNRKGTEWGLFQHAKGEVVYTIEHLTVLITPWEERVGGGEEDGMGTRNSSPISVFASSLPYPTHSGSCDSQPPHNCANHQNPRILHGTLWWLWSR